MPGSDVEPADVMAPGSDVGVRVRAEAIVVVVVVVVVAIAVHPVPATMLGTRFELGALGLRNQGEEPAGGWLA
jgi:hypothetical protein